MTDSRAVVIKITDEEMDDCVRCTVSMTSDTDKVWVVCNVYEDCCIIPVCKRCLGVGRRWDRLDRYHESCYDLSDQPHGLPHEPRKKKRVPVRETEDWENE